MAGGDCVKATFMEFLDVAGKDKDQYRYVVVLRSVFGMEHFGFHCLLKKTNADGSVTMIDASNSARNYFEDGELKQGDKKVMTWDEWVAKDNPILDGKYTYVEWEWLDVLDIFLGESDDFLEDMPLAMEAWSLDKKQWKERFPEFKNHADYMRNYFMPKFQPTILKLHEESDKKKGVAWTGLNEED